MSVAAVMLVKDEIDVIESTLGHLAEQVDWIIVSDNLSTDGTSELIRDLDLPLTVIRDEVIAYWQSTKTTALADAAREMGHDWVVPCDADEMWVAVDGRPISAYLRSIPPDVLALRGAIYNYMPTAEDVGDELIPNPFKRIGWRLAEPQYLGKMCARLVPNLVIGWGNHDVTIDGIFPPLVGGGLRINHYPWRSTQQFAKKVVNGARAYAAIEELDPSTGAHWRMWGDPDAEDLPERAADHFRRYFWASHPPYPPGSLDKGGLVFEPAL